MSITEQKDAIKDRQLDRNEKADESSAAGSEPGFEKKYLLVINLVLAVYLILPVMAPVLMKTGASGAADLIYRIYKPPFVTSWLIAPSFFLANKAFIRGSWQRSMG